MENNIIKVQLASSASFGMKIESKNKNTISDSEQTFDQVLSHVSNQKVWKKEEKEQLSFPIAYGQTINVWNGNEQTRMSEGTISSDAQQFSHIISSASEQYNVPQSVIKAVIQAESSFNTNATSSAGAKGLMQLMDGTAKGLGVTNSYDPVQNINGGTKYLSLLLNKYDGQIKAALAAYNAGPTRVDRLGISTNEQFDQLSSTLPTETQNYVKKIFSYL